MLYGTGDAQENRPWSDMKHNSPVGEGDVPSSQSLLKTPDSIEPYSHAQRLSVYVHDTGHFILQMKYKELDYKRYQSAQL